MGGYLGIRELELKTWCYTLSNNVSSSTVCCLGVEISSLITQIVHLRSLLE